MDNQNRVDTFIMAVRSAAPMLMRHIFADGGCYRFHLILKTVFPSAVPRWTKDHCHVVSKIFGYYWDINGEVKKEEVDVHKRFTAANRYRACFYQFDEMLFCAHKLRKIVTEGYKD